MKFEIRGKSSFGDEIDPQSGYNFTVDDVLLATSFDDYNEDIDYFESITFGDDCTSTPSSVPSDVRSDRPSISPTSVPSNTHSDKSSITPSSMPSDTHSDNPSFTPSSMPSDTHSDKPSVVPSSAPSNIQANQVSSRHLRRMIHIQTNQVYFQCSSSLLNLETTYHAVQRARNDTQVMRTFEVVNDALKQVRSELDGVGDVEEITGTLRSNIQDVEEVHDSLFGGNLSTNSDETNDMKELEAELELLVSEENVDPLSAESGGACSDAALVVKKNGKPEYSTLAKKELQETDLPRVKNNDAIINRTDGPVDDSSRKQKKIAQ